MAPEQTPLPGGSLPGMRNSRFSGDDGASREEVQQRIRNLYDRAEDDSGTYNATRVANAGPRNRVTTGVNMERRRADPALDEVARQWFEGARRKLGPTVPAALPADRMPDRVDLDRLAPPARRPGSELTAGELRTTDRPLPELTAGPATGTTTGALAELTAGPGTASRPPAELTAGPVAALPAAPRTRPETNLALPAPAGESRPSRLSTSKEQNQRKLAAARELLSRHVARISTAPAAIESRAVEDAWRTSEGQAFGLGDTGWQSQQPAAFGTAPSGMSVDAGAAFSTGTSLPTAAMFPTAAPYPTELPVASGTSLPAAAPFPTEAPVATGTPFPTTAFFPAEAPLPITVPYPTEAPVATGTPLPAPALFPTEAPAAGTPLPTTAPFPAEAPIATGAPLPTGTSLPTVPPVPTEAFIGVGGVPETGYGAKASKASKALAFAREQIGKPCVWGAAGPGSYDASGLTQAAWKAAGVALPRGAQDQARTGTPIPLTDIQPGDLVFFYDDDRHVGLCTGNGMMIHAPSPGAYIREESLFFAGSAAIHSAARPA
ncbi:NlpC/P60 family protein [Streptomyces sp. NPDC001795]|uniref:C40 family peptidase n=1 Tax=Streptomyces sp. NPDC001795 TaxID=3154525 RepID=UPI00331BCCB1